MKHLKYFEGVESKIVINLLQLCNHYDGDMYIAVDKLIELKENCEKYEIEILDQYNYSHSYKNLRISHNIINDDFNIDEGDNKSININTMEISYGYLKRTKNTYLFTFYNVPVDEELLSFITANKYNL